MRQLRREKKDTRVIEKKISAVTYFLKKLTMTGLIG